MLIYEFAGNLTNDAALDPAGLVAIAIAHAFALFVGVSIAANISGGHLNPAVTFGLAVGGHITVITGFFYWVAQLLGATAASYLLIYVTGGKVHTHTHKHKYKNCMHFSCSLSIFFATKMINLNCDFCYIFAGCSNSWSWCRAKCI